MHDLVELEKRGLPTVALCAKAFEVHAKAIAKARGLTAEAFQYALVKDCLTGIPPDTIRAQATASVPAVIAALTSKLDSSTAAERAPDAATVEIFEGDDKFDAFVRMNESYLDAGWGDGFPLWPATRDKVARMMKATPFSPQSVIGVVDPGHGVATVEKIAINAVMAGCVPEHMPVLIAALKAMTTPPFPMWLTAASTSPHAPLLMVNGPIVKKLGIHSGCCALGPGDKSRVNTVIGRAIRLIMMNVGHAYPEKGDMDTLGTALKYSMCIAENEQSSPWEPFHYRRGFLREKSTVTVFPVRDIIEIEEQYNWTAEGIMSSIAAITSIPSWDYLHDRYVEDDPINVVAWHALLVLSPDHARAMHSEGWNTEHVKEHLYHQQRVPLRSHLSRLRANPKEIRPHFRWAFDAPQDMTLPVLRTADCLHVAVAGADSSSGKSQYMRMIGQPSSTVEIATDDSDGGDS